MQALQHAHSIDAAVAPLFAELKIELLLDAAFKLMETGVPTATMHTSLNPTEIARWELCGAACRTVMELESTGVHVGAAEKKKALWNLAASLCHLRNFDEGIEVHPRYTY